MADRVRYVPNRRGIRQLLTSRQMADMLTARAQKGLDAARAMAPRDTGRYADSLHLERQVVGDRVIVGIVSDDPKAPILEARHRGLGRAADQIR